jgi:phage terminase Nu1 subunit (DNA packaging protein)
MRGGKRAGAGRPRAPGESLEAARRRLARANADRRELEVRRLRGELLDADATARAWATLARDVRAAVLAVPGRVATALPHLTPTDIDTIDREIRAALVGLGAPA